MSAGEERSERMSTFPRWPALSAHVPCHSFGSVMHPPTPHISSVMHPLTRVHTHTPHVNIHRYVFNEMNHRFPTLPFSLRALEDEKQARMGVVECLKHDLLHPYPVRFSMCLCIFVYGSDDTDDDLPTQSEKR